MAFDTLRFEDVLKHNTRQSCWVIVSGRVYDVTKFLDEHPGGSSIILKYGGKDATEEYDPIHPPGTLESQPEEVICLGQVEVTESRGDQSLKAVGPAEGDELNLDLMLCLDDVENAAQKVLTPKAWAYYNSASDSLASLRANRNDWSKISFRPRVLRNVHSVDMSCRIMGQSSSLPFFVAPASRARLVHKDGELCIARGITQAAIPYCTSNIPSISHRNIADCVNTAKKGGCLLFQLYVPIRKSKARDSILMARCLGFRALVLTVDSAVIGKREEDERHQAKLDVQAARIEREGTHKLANEEGSHIASSLPILRGAHSATLVWDDLEWIRYYWNSTGPIVLKGIQTAEDARKAFEIGIDGIYLSNHGGRQVDHAPSAIRTLLEIRRFCPEILGKIEIYLDGGVRRGADIVKALALGATAVAIGRPFMYACAFGEQGVSKVIQCESLHTTPLGVHSCANANCKC